MQAIGKLYSYAYIASGNAAAAADRGTRMFGDTIFAEPWTIIASTAHAANFVIQQPHDIVKSLTKVDSEAEKRKLPAPSNPNKRFKSQAEVIQDLFTSDFDKLDTGRLEEDVNNIKNASRRGFQRARDLAEADELRRSINQ